MDTYQVDVENASGLPDIPGQHKFQQWARQALQHCEHKGGELCIRIVDRDEMTALNQTYRHKHGATNVLSFCADLPPEIPGELLGDIVICAPLVAEEASEQGIDTEAHWAHLVVHGTLHLLGFDHIENDDAEEMENLETRILTTMHFPAPYQVLESSITNGDKAAP